MDVEIKVLASSYKFMSNPFTITWQLKIQIFVEIPKMVQSYILENLSASCDKSLVRKTLPKAQRTRGLSSSYQSNFLRSYHEFLQRAYSNFIFIILTKNQHQNLNQTSTFRLNLNFKILTKPSFKLIAIIVYQSLSNSS